MADKWSDQRFFPPPSTSWARHIPYHNSYDYFHSNPPPLHAKISSYSHSSYPKPNPSYPVAEPRPPETFKTSHYYTNLNSYLAGDNPFAPHGGYAAEGPTPISSLQRHTPAAATSAAGEFGDHYYGRNGIGGGRGQAYLNHPDGNEFALIEAIRQYSADPAHLSTVSDRLVLRHQVPVGRFRPQPQVGQPHSSPQSGAPKPKPKSKPKKNPSSITKTFYCNVCNIDYKSETVFITHEQGKKHKMNLENLKGSIAQQTTNPKTEAVTTNKGKNNKKLIPQKAEISIKRKNNKNNDDALETKKRKVLDAGSELSEVKVCEIYNAVANSQMVFEALLPGSRHLESLKKAHAGG